MATKLSAETFRSTFKAVDKELVRWFPGHMDRGLKQMRQKLKSVDCIMEVHDARIPVSGRNADFKYTLSGIKPHILVLNKVDLISKQYRNRIEGHLKNEYEHVVFTNCKDQHCKGVQKLFPLAQELITSSDRYNRSNVDDYNVMIIGIPNVGKSSLVNALRVRYLRKGNAASVGALPGVTRHVMNKIKMCEQPLFYMLDTPGILTPTIGNVEVGLKLALCANIQDHLVGQNIIADYLLYWLNKQKHFQYVDFFSLDKPSDNVLSVLAHISQKYNKTIKVRDSLNNYVLRPDLERAARIVLRAFRKGS